MGAGHNRLPVMISPSSSFRYRFDNAPTGKVTTFAKKRIIAPAEGTRQQKDSPKQQVL